MTFDEVLGHDIQIQILQRAIASNQLAHGYLFDGKGGIGKRQVAMALAKTVLCGSGIEACGMCPSCIQFDSENHPDFLLITPDGLSIKDKQMEDFQSFIHVKPYESNTKVLIIDQSDLMTVRAQNRILKVVEEPPGHALMIFVTENREAMLPTVLSRLQRLSFNRLSAAEMEEWLIAKGYDAELTPLAARYADGSLGRAVELLITPDFSQRRDSAIACLRALHEGDTLKAFERIEPYLTDKVSTISFMELVIIWYRDTVLYQTDPNSPLRFIQTEDEDFVALSQLLDLQRVPVYIEIVEAAKKAIGDNANHPLVAEAMLLKLTGGQL